MVMVLLQRHDNFTCWIHIFLVFRSIEFVTGIILGILFSIKNKYEEKKINKSTATLFEVAILFLFFIERILCKYTMLYENLHNYKSIVGFLIVIGTMYLFEHTAGILSKFISNRYLIYIANISFEIYIIYQTVMKYCDLFIYKWGWKALDYYNNYVHVVVSNCIHYYGFKNKRKMRKR